MMVWDNTRLSSQAVTYIGAIPSADGGVERVVDLDGGKGNTFFLTASDKVYATGSQTTGQVGTGSTSNITGYMELDWLLRQERQVHHRRRDHHGGTG